MTSGLVGLTPDFPIGSEAANAFTLFAVELADGDVSSIDALRDAWLLRISPSASHGQALRVCISVLADLKMQGWGLHLREEGIFVEKPNAHSTDAALHKERVKRGHLRERDYQLAQSAVRQFVAEMERPRLGRNGWVSIFSLMRDGRELAARLSDVQSTTDLQARADLLERCVDPYLQPVTAGGVCELTGLRLGDIWRYFRHTWTNHYSSTPGRQVAFLVRDRAVEYHPVIGIGAYGSAVVQLSVRDEWIGWTPECFLKRLAQEPSRLGPWILRSLQELIAAIYVQDFVDDGTLERRALRTPDQRLVDRLGREALKASQRHHADPQPREHKASTNNGDNWAKEARSPLFRAKRAKTLAQLLTARAAFQAVGFTDKAASDVEQILRNGRCLQAIRTVLRQTKAAHVGVDMVDITVCGAVAPYGPILGGKLVSLLLASPDAVAEYERRYRNAVSVIASSMAGRPIVRTPKLVLLGTTSLYGTASSQYNRIKVAADVLGASSTVPLEFKELGRSEGFGSFHFSTRTLNEIETLLAQHRDGRRFNSIFGEGVNPKLRKLRSGLEAVGFPADVVLRHGDSRLVYGVALATNFRDVLLGVAKRRVPLIPGAQWAVGSTRLVQYWRRRWLTGRIDRPGIIEQVASHTLVRPIRHGARVVLPEHDDAAAAQQPLIEISQEA
jgi:hypothetical protein